MMIATIIWIFMSGAIHFDLQMFLLLDLVFE